MKSDKRTDEIDALLKSCLHTEQKPDDALHQKVMQKWKEQSNMKKRKFYKAAAAAAAILLASTLSVGAAVRFFTPKEAAEELGGTKIADLFESDEAVLINETQEGGQYAYTLLGLTEGKNLLQLDEDGSYLEKDAFYAVVAVSHKDGSDLSLDEFQESENGHFISPLIQGLEPWMYNIASMNGGYSEMGKDGIVYRMINCDKIGYFADRQLYLCISDTTFYDNDAYDYDEKSGIITRNVDYEGTNLLFDLPIASSRANADLAENYLKELEEEWNPDAEESAESGEDSETDTGIGNPSARADYALYQETLNSAPEELENVLTNLGMTVTDRQTVEKKDDRYCFEQKLEDGLSNQIIFYTDGFENGIAESCEYSESETEAELLIEVAQLQEDGTAICTFYQKTYPVE